MEITPLIYTTTVKVFIVNLLALHSKTVLSLSSVLFGGWGRGVGGGGGGGWEGKLKGRASFSFF